MNARQKAKKYKQELERLRNHVDPCKTVPYTVSYYDYKEYGAQITYDPLVPTDFIKKELAHKLIYDIYYDGLIEFDNDITYGQHVMTARLKVLDVRR